jgi:hypothetical protein
MNQGVFFRFSSERLPGKKVTGHIIFQSVFPVECFLKGISQGRVRAHQNQVFRFRVAFHGKHLGAYGQYQNDKREDNG